MAPSLNKHQPAAIWMPYKAYDVMWFYAYQDLITFWLAQSKDMMKKVAFF